MLCFIITNHIRIQEYIKSATNCNCVAHILHSCGFETDVSLINITENEIKRIENFASQEQLAAQLNCRHAPNYKSLKQFTSLPGHRAILLNIPKNSSEASVNIDEVLSLDPPHHQFLQLLLESSLLNHHKEPTARRFNQNLRYLCTYIYLMGGKS